MKKLLNILTTSSFVFLITAGIAAVNKNSNENNIYFSKKLTSRPHKIEKGVLKEVGYDVLPNGVVQIKRIDYTVSTITALLPEEITSLKSAFQTNTNMINWQVVWDTKNITDMSYAFYNTTWINEKSIANWNTSNVTNMEGMFGLSKSFNQDISNWDVSKVKNFKQMFYHSTAFNNNEKPLNWDVKLKSAVNMESMFDKASAFTQNLSGWTLNNSVNNKNFGIQLDRQPKWKVEVPKPIEKSLKPNTAPNNSTLPADTPENLENQVSPKKSETEKKPEIVDKLDNIPSSPSISETPKNINDSIDTPNNLIIQPPIESKPEISSEKPKHPLSTENETIEKNESLKEDKIKNSKIDNNSYKIPAKPNTIIKSNSPSAGLIAGSVLGSFTVLGIVGGTSYYYRKNLKNFYLNSADKTKNLYFKSKEKIKDKLSKIKSKK
ncbi:BspA family leucine-rich repeat surface protein [Mycoplasma mycoides subsp. capri]|uniref:BspA family leucine-rich repeat surface protein n=2 Tax=Mycoplasma mycoides TaxID=2102 RepID=UPI00224010D2|nr:BspA family leucine-rich repeat surface protein [Mycoplasma mycoides]QVK04583.1 BspA family leucine-rich repeat surface protein [Mycoplasma mycoides subsp. capri]